jgi:hypothetical protein
VDFPIKNCDFPQLCGCLPEGNGWLLVLSHLKKYGSFQPKYGSFRMVERINRCLKPATRGVDMFNL